MTEYRVTGMTCGGCEKSVVKAVERKVPGVTVTASHDAQVVRVEGAHDPEAVKAAIDGAGFRFEG